VAVRALKGGGGKGGEKKKLGVLFFFDPITPSRRKKKRKERKIGESVRFPSIPQSGAGTKEEKGKKEEGQGRAARLGIGGGVAQKKRNERP